MKPIPTEIISLLVCPRCGGRFRQTEEAFICTNDQCAGEYPIRQNVPILLDLNITSSFQDDAEDGRGIPSEAEPGGGRGLRQTLSSLIPSITANPGAGHSLEQFTGLLHERTKRPRLLVVGGRVFGDSSEPLINDSSVVALETDIAPGPRAQLLCDAHNLPFEDGAFDGVLAQAVLEHVLDPVRCVDEIHRVLGPAGLVYADTPFLQPVHGAPFDFTRFTMLGHRRLFRSFDEVESGMTVGPGSALAWMWVSFLRSFSDRESIRSVLGTLGRVSGFWLKYFDSVMERRAGALDAAGGHYFIGTRSDAPIPDTDLVTQYRGGFVT